MLLSCTRQETEEVTPAQTFRTLEFNVTTPGTKAIFGEKSGSSYPVSWTANDAPAITYNTVANIYQVSDFTLTGDGTSARFTWAVPEGEDSYYFNLVSPFNALKTFYNGNRINVEIPSGQTCTPGSPDENAIILYAGTSTYDKANLPSSLDVTFKHVPAYMRLIFSNLDKVSDDEVVQAVVIESADLNIAGRIFFYTDNGTWAENSSAMVKAVTVSTSQLDNVWVALAPVDLSDKTLSFIVNTDKNTYTKKVTFPADRKLTSGRTAKYTVNMADANVEKIVEYELVTSESNLHYGDELIIAAADSDVAISTSQKADNRSATGITRDGTGTKIIGASSAVEVFILGDGLIPGSWSLYATSVESDGYIYAADGYNENNKNWLRTTKDNLDALGSWSINFGDMTSNDKADSDPTRAIIMAQTGGDKHCLLRYNAESSIFSAYNTGTGMSPVKIYRKVQAPDTTPRLKVTDAAGAIENVALGFAEQTVKVYVFGNVSWTANVTGGLTLDKTSGTGPGIITFTIPENSSTTEDLNYTVTVSAEAADKSLTFYQARKAPQVSDILWQERWNGIATNNTNANAYPTNTSSTTVFNGASVTYSSNKGSGNTRTYNDYIIYISNYDAGTYEDEIPDELNAWNLMIGQNGGWFKVSGIPCSDVKTAKLTFLLNSNGAAYYTASSNTDGVSFGTREQTTTQSKYRSQKSSTDHSMVDTYKNIYTVTYDISFTNTGISTFDIKFDNSKTSGNVRAAEMKVEVLETWGNYPIIP